jgi:hypothetical protein
MEFDTYWVKFIAITILTVVLWEAWKARKRQRVAKLTKMSPLANALDRVLGIHLHGAPPKIHLDLDGHKRRLFRK